MIYIYIDTYANTHPNLLATYDLVRMAGGMLDRSTYPWPNARPDYTRYTTTCGLIRASACRQ